MIYAAFRVKGSCKGCGKPTEYHIEGDYPVCKTCIKQLFYDVKVVLEE